MLNLRKRKKKISIKTIRVILAAVYFSIWFVFGIIYWLLHDTYSQPHFLYTNEEQRLNVAIDNVLRIEKMENFPHLWAKSLVNELQNKNIKDYDFMQVYSREQEPNEDVLTFIGQFYYFFLLSNGFESLNIYEINIPTKMKQDVNTILTEVYLLKKGEEGPSIHSEHFYMFFKKPSYGLFTVTNKLDFSKTPNNHLVVSQLSSLDPGFFKQFIISSSKSFPFTDINNFEYSTYGWEGFFGIITLPERNYNQSLIDFLYFSAVTITTLGYGDILPCSTVGRVFVMIESFLGIITIGFFISSVFLEKKKLDDKDIGSKT